MILLAVFLIGLLMVSLFSSDFTPSASGNGIRLLRYILNGTIAVLFLAFLAFVGLEVVRILANF